MESSKRTIVMDRVGRIIARNDNIVYCVEDGGRRPVKLRHGIVVAIDWPNNELVVLAADHGKLVRLHYPQERVAVV